VPRTESTSELLAQLPSSGPGFQPYLLTARSPELTAQDDISPPLLAAVLDEPMAMHTTYRTPFGPAADVALRDPQHHHGRA
jgi:hypothetical protein